MKIISEATISNWSNKIFSISSHSEFNALALEIFHFQYKNNSIYNRFVDSIGVKPKAIGDYEKIPFLPVEFFKNNKVVNGQFDEEIIFKSSGTTSMFPAMHYVADLGVYETSFMTSFRKFLGDINGCCILGLLPSYIEREGSSLIYMINHLIRQSQDQNSGFYIKDYKKLKVLLEDNKRKGKKTILFGVSFALMDFAEKYQIHFPELIIIETGGMKGRRKEIIREDLHNRISTSFGVEKIYSEYGMTELMSQAYAYGNGLFRCPPWMQVLIGDIHDPFANLPYKKSGNIKIIDLANVFSCSFLSTQDLGVRYPDNAFEVLGRIDFSDIRGCSLLL